MPNLIESLQGRDVGHLQIIAQLWGIELERQADRTGIVYLSTALLEPLMVNKMMVNLPDEARSALGDLISHDGRLPWAQFSRTYGELREMGKAKRDRERPYEHPISVVETLWYRGLIAISFFDSPAGPEEFTYIPDDLLKLVSPPVNTKQNRMGRQASATEYANISPVNDRILDHACTTLAALRLGSSLPESFATTTGETLTGSILISLLVASDLLEESGTPKPEPTRIHLEAQRGEAMLQLLQAWRRSSSINELTLLPGLSLEGNWVNDPLETRNKLMGYLQLIPANTWWSLGSFISAVKQRDPDFQRPAGDYDSWFIRNKLNDEYLRGFEHWDDVDGRLVRYFLTGPLYWLGVLDLASPGEGQEVSAFRFSRWAKALLNSKPPSGLAIENENLVARSDARVSARRLVPRRVRYQLARFCEWEKETPDEYQYRISPASLKQAKQQGLAVGQLVTLLNRNAKVVPPSLIKALENWEKQGVVARLEQMVVLRVVSEEILQALKKSRASRFLGEALGPTSIAVNAGAADKVLGVLAELGYLGESRVEKS